MISGTFHVMAQEWRYYSREKSLIHTLHLGEITPSITGGSIIIPIVPPTGSGATANKFGLGGLVLPTITPYGGVQWDKVTNNIPMMWAHDAGFWPSSQSGSYGFSSGSLSHINPLITMDEEFWMMTGGAYLFLGLGSFVGGATPSNPSSVRVQLTQQTAIGDVSNVRHQGDYFVRMEGTDWITAEFVQFGDALIVSAVMQNVPYGQALGVYGQTSPLEPTFNGTDTNIGLVLRLGP